MISHGWTWACWSVVLASGVDVWTWPWTFWLYLGGLGPPLAGVAMTASLYGGAGLRDLWWRLVDVTRIRWRWYAVIVVLPPTLLLLAVGTRWVVDGELAFDVEVFRAKVHRPLQLLSFAAFLLALGPLPEEIGWRGYALDRLQERLNALWSSIVLGLAWGAWHIPLFTMTGYYARFGNSPDLGLFLYDIVLNAMLYTWIYNNTGRSLLAAVLFHFVINFSGEFLPGTDPAAGWNTLLKTLVVALVLVLWGPRRLVRANSPGPVHGV